MLITEKTFPGAAIDKAELAYGSDIARKLMMVTEALAAPARLDDIARSLRMSPATAVSAVGALERAIDIAWPAMHRPGDR